MVVRPQNKFGLFFLILLLFLVVSLQLYIASPTRPKQIIFSNAQNAGCSEIITGNEKYGDKIMPIGPNIAAQNSPENYRQIRLAYNCQNTNNQAVKSNFIPVTVIYDLFFLKGDAATIANNLVVMKQYGLYPIIRVASYTSGGSWIKLTFDPKGTNDRYLMGANLAEAISKVSGFPQQPVVLFGNEPNLDEEWGGDANGNEFREAFIDFSKGMASKTSGNKNYLLFFPALSYGGTGKNSPSVFLSAFFSNPSTFAQKIDGAALNIYGSTFASIQSQYNDQSANLNAYSNNFDTPIKTLISELGPTRQGQADQNCQSDEWRQLSSDVISGYIKNPPTFATMACFGNTTLPSVIDYTQGTGQLITLNGGTQQNTGGGGTGGGGTGGGTNQTGFSINFNPQNPAPDTSFNITTSSGTGYTWVYMKIFKQGDDNNAVWVAANNLGDEPSVKSSAPFEWTYHIDLGAPKTLPAGDYKVVFYANCDKGCSEVGSRTLSIGAGKTNTQQTPQTQPKTQTQTQTNQNQTQTQTQQTTQQTQQSTQNQKPQTPQNNVFDAKFCNEKIQVPGPKEFKLNIIFLPSNYNDLNKFLNDSKNAASTMWDTNLGSKRVNKINFWAYKSVNTNLPPKACGSAAGFNTVCTDDGMAKKMSDDCGMDGYVAIVDDPRKAASTLALGTIQVTMTSSALESFPHELGHGVASIFDEYDFQDGRPPNIPLPVNCSSEASENQTIACPPWKKYGDVGCFPRCGFWSWYKPTEQSIMNDLRKNKTFNSPSLEAWDYALQKYDKYQ